MIERKWTDDQILAMNDQELDAAITQVDFTDAEALILCVLQRMMIMFQSEVEAKQQVAKHQPKILTIDNGGIGPK